MTRGKRILPATFVALTALGGSVASAADLPLRPIEPVPTSPWTGFYAGIDVGGAIGNGSVTTTGTPLSFNPAGVDMGAPATMYALAAVLPSHTSRSSGQFIGGGQLGYNYQLSSPYVVGLEADIQGLAGSGGTSSAATASSFAPYGFPANNYGANSTFNERLGYLGTVRGRVGYLITPRLLVYATGGLAYGGTHVGSSYAIQETFPGN